MESTFVVTHPFDAGALGENATWHRFIAVELKEHFHLLVVNEGPGVKAPVRVRRPIEGDAIGGDGEPAHIRSLLAAHLDHAQASAGQPTAPLE